MKELGIDVLVSYKGWSGTPCAGLICCEKAVAQVEATESDSFSLDLKQWLTVAACL